MKDKTIGGRVLLLMITALLQFSCVTDDDFELPGSAVGVAADLETNTDLDAILGSFFQGDGEIVTIRQDLVIPAYVVSSDEAGNFYKELIVQDKPANPTAGIAIQINQASYYGTYDFGRKIFIRLKGLSVGEKNGVVVLGLANGKQIEQIPLSKISDFILRTSEVAEIVPLKVRALDFNDRRENLYIEIEEVQFSKFLVDPANSFTFASEDNDQFDGEREIESCSGDFSVILSTSTYADFKAFKLPSKSGSLQGILTRDFYDDFFTIYLNSPADIDFSQQDRCDPVFLNCGLAERAGRKIIFAEEFTGTNNKPVTGKGWTNHVQEGSKAWEVFTATGVNASLGKSARVRPSGSGDHKTVSWLVTPQIDFEVLQGEVLSFKSSTSFANHSTMEVLISNDWDGTVENFDRATWKLLPAAYIARSSDFYGDWFSSGNVDLSCVNGKGYIGFRYTGSDHLYYNGVYELDDVLISVD